MNTELNRYQLIDPPEGDFSDKYEFLENQMYQFLTKNQNQYPFIVESDNEVWKFMSSESDMLVASEIDLHYYPISFLNKIWVTSTTTVDMAFDDQVIIDRAHGIYQEYCIKKDQISFKKFYDAYASMNDALMILIR